MAENNGGPSDPLEALRALVKHRIPEEIALRFGSGVLAPLRLANRFIRNLVIWEDGVPKLNRELAPILHQQKQITARMEVERAADRDDIVAFGMGCPVAHPMDHKNEEERRNSSGVQLLAETLLYMMEDQQQRRAAGVNDPLPKHHRLTVFRVGI